MIPVTDLRLGDCLEIMPSIADGSIDMILADLPYGNTANDWDRRLPLDLLWAQYSRIIKDNGAIVLTATQPFATDLINSKRKWFRYDLVWDKRCPVGFLNANKMPLRRHEGIYVFYKKLPTYNPQKTAGAAYRSVRRTANKNYRDYKSTLTINNGDRYPVSILGGMPSDRPAGGHPTQKPVTLMEYLIRTYTNEGETVLDNTMGSGTTLVACVHTGRSGIGIEKDGGYFQVAVKNISEAQEAVRQLEMAAS